jgi:PHD/YefM family antitoxin component YafN of YafNO toxin-antitoxin module
MDSGSETTMSNAVLHPEYITDAEGHRRSVVLPLEEYEALMEDLADLAIVAERRSEPVHSHQAVKEELERDGYLSG